MAALTASMLGAAPPAFAHITSDMGGGVAAGFLHPLTGFDHLLAMVSVGIWGAQLGLPSIWLLPIAFPLIMAIGAVFGVIGVPLPGTEILIALSVLTLGAMVALKQRLPVAAALLVVGIFAVAHGHAHGAEMPNAADALSFTVGFVVATGLLHATGIVIGLLDRSPGGAVALRACGLFVGLVGCYFVYESVGA
ncbi:MAG TPA: HupE/UreJ family protein [Stellaceae bacterium]|nr:HupE/UreJ family protein [Stellaceae bacterium]